MAKKALKNKKIKVIEGDGNKQLIDNNLKTNLEKNELGLYNLNKSTFNLSTQTLTTPKRSSSFFPLSRKVFYSFISTNIVLIIINILILGFLIYNFKPNISISQANFASTSTDVITQSEYGITKLDNFYQDKAILNIGAKIDMKNNFLQTNFHANCQTPVIPPDINGCAFLIDPLKITSNPNTIFNAFLIDVDLKQDSQILVSNKKLTNNNVTSENTDNFKFEINSKNQKDVFLIPSKFVDSTLLEFKLWDKNKSNIKIKSLTFLHQNTNDAKEVNLVFSQKFIENNKNKKFKFYQDTNYNSQLDVNIDRNFSNCLPQTNLPYGGLDFFETTSQPVYSYKVQHRYECIKDQSKQYFTLMPGKWFMVDEDNSNNNYLIDIAKDKASYKIEL